MIESFPSLWHTKRSPPMVDCVTRVWLQRLKLSSATSRPEGSGAQHDRKKRPTPRSD